MNAYELAVELSEFMTEDKYTDLDKTIFKTCNMLRQQADELEAFKLNFYNTGYTLQLRDKDETIRQQADRIAELEKSHIELEKGIVADLNQRQSAEPFIWLKQDFDGEWIEVHPNKGTPLYTTPQIKELSDEEIIEVFEKPFHKEPTGKINDEVIAFARAILKKASEK
jgi:hypothetical protein